MAEDAQKAADPSPPPAFVEDAKKAAASAADAVDKGMDQASKALRSSIAWIFARGQEGLEAGSGLLESSKVRARAHARTHRCARRATHTQACLCADRCATGAQMSAACDRSLASGRYDLEGRPRRARTCVLRIAACARPAITAARAARPRVVR